MLYRLAATLDHRGLNTGSLVDFDDAIDASAQAIENTPADFRDYFRFVAALAQIFKDRFGFSKSLSDLTAAIETYQAAADAAPDEHPQRAEMLTKIRRLRQLSADSEFR